MNGAAERLPVVVLISGHGSNLRAIARQAELGTLPVEIRAVISDRTGAPGLDWAATAGLETAVVPAREFADRSGFDAALAAEVERHAPGLVVLAGFMRVLGSGFVDRFAGVRLDACCVGQHLLDLAQFTLLGGWVGCRPDCDCSRPVG